MYTSLIINVNFSCRDLSVIQGETEVVETDENDAEFDLQQTTTGGSKV